MGLHESAGAYKDSCAVHRQIRLAQRHPAVAVYAFFTLLQYIYIYIYMYVYEYIIHRSQPNVIIIELN